MLNELSRRTTFINGIRATAALAGAMLIFANCLMRTQPQPRSASHKPNFHVIFQDSAYLISIASYVRRNLLFYNCRSDAACAKGLFASILDFSFPVTSSPFQLFALSQT